LYAAFDALTGRDAVHLIEKDLPKLGFALAHDAG
jgi:hypothetical protein